MRKSAFIALAVAALATTPDPTDDSPPRARGAHQGVYGGGKVKRANGYDKPVKRAKRKAHKKARRAMRSAA